MTLDRAAALVGQQVTYHYKRAGVVRYTTCYPAVIKKVYGVTVCIEFTRPTDGKRLQKNVYPTNLHEKI